MAGTERGTASEDRHTPHMQGENPSCAKGFYSERASGEEERQGVGGGGREEREKDDSRIQSLVSNEQVHHTQTAHETEWRCEEE